MISHHVSDSILAIKNRRSNFRTELSLSAEGKSGSALKKEKETVSNYFAYFYISVCVDLILLQFIQ